MNILPIYLENSIFKEPFFQTIYSYQLLIVVYLHQLRLWFIYYDLRKTKHLISLKYQSRLHFKQRKNHLPWTLRYKKTLGNIKFMTIITLVVSFSISIAVIIMSVYNIESLFNLLAPALSLIFLIPLTIVVASLKDEIGIGREIRAYCLSVVIFFVAYAIGNFVFPTETLQKQRDCYMFILWGPLMMLAVLRSVHLPSLRLKNSNCLAEIFHMYACDICNCYSIASRQLTNITSDKRITLNDILSDQDGVDAFVVHCTNEFSVENILYIIELHDLKTILIDNNIINTANMETDHDIWEMSMNKPLLIPDNNKSNSYNMKTIKSFSVNTILDECIQHLLYLYNEYIKYDAISVINISAKQRNVLNIASQKLNDPNMIHDDITKSTVIANVFSEHMRCGKSIYNLLRNDTWMRFKQTNQFKRLSESITK